MLKVDQMYSFKKKQFVLVFRRDSSYIAAEFGKHQNTITAPHLNIDRKEVLKIPKYINIHKAMGPDGILTL